MGKGKDDPKAGKSQDELRRESELDATGTGSPRTDYNTYDWSGRQTDDYRDVRRKGSDR